MVEFKKYKIGDRRFGIINWVGAFSLYKKEVFRFLIVSGQTLIGPIITSILFLMVISLAIGDAKKDVLGAPFIIFLAPGLIAMQVIQQSFAHSSSSLIMSKMMGTIQDIIGSPLSSAEVTTSIILASVTRGFLISIISSAIFYLFLDLEINSYIIFIIYLFLGTFMLGSLGFIAGLFANKFDEMATITNFLIVPLSFLSGTFYSINRLPDLLQTISYYNPFFHMIDGFRYAFINQMDGSIKFGIIYLSVLSIIFWMIAYYLFKKGYNIKS
tara:strand:- start:293 stop:1102 length:810 start_codon:yes stop_codon:yes gene_type:complete